ncbi:MAG: proline iminopeptidase [Chloroflexota bacterium]|nr:proline iminopeptidase [Chloroflexota bacterium]
MTESFVDVNGCRTWTATVGSGPPVVLVHGGPGICDYTGPVAAMLSDRYSVRRYEQRGCGRTAAVPPYDMATLVADLESLRAGWHDERVRLIGHSFGASLAFLYASEHPERVERLVLWCGTGIADGWQARHRDAVAARLTAAERARMDELRELRLADTPDPEGSLDREAMRLLALSDLADRANERLLPDPVFEYPANWPVNRDVNRDWQRLVASGELETRARGLGTWTLVWAAGGDPRPADPARQLASFIPNARFESLPDAGHIPWFERPDAVRARLVELLA